MSDKPTLEQMIRYILDGDGKFKGTGELTITRDDMKPRSVVYDIDCGDHSHVDDDPIDGIEALYRALKELAES